jgi:peptidyl-prolyl cis-trans isomerase D
MITWMQTHKKWLIITIWIATIAFVGAGFVGWGAYSYGKKQDEVARVKDTSIKVKDIQDIYSQLFNQLNQVMGGKLDEATAKQFGLEKAAFQQALQRAMVIQFAKDNGLYITDEELAQALISMPAFHDKNGKFNEKLYKLFLQQARMEPKEYEANLRKDLLIQKVLQAISLPSTKTTQTTLGALLTMKDKVSIDTIKAPSIEVTEDEIKKYWQKHKEKYKSITSYNIGYFYVALEANVSDAEISNYYDEHKTNYTDKDGAILPLDKVKDKVKTDLLAKKTKKEAILTMKKLKKDELKWNKADNVSTNNKYISTDNMNKLIQTKFLKPTLTPKGWLIATLFKINKPEVLPYEKAKEFAKQDLIKQKTKETLIKLAQDNLKNFKGQNIGFLSRDDIMKLNMMSINDAKIFLQTLFSSDKPTGFVLLPNEENPTKVVLFKITEQKLLDKKKYEKYQQMVVNYANKLKNDTLNTNLMKELERLYQAQIKIYMKI